MKWISTKSSSVSFGLKDVLFKGLAPNGGLFMPSIIPSFSVDFKSNRIPDIGVELLGPYFSPDIPEETLSEILEDALNFDVPLKQLSDDLFVLELFHGPTLAFKDVGARTMAGMMDYLYEGDQPLTILAATSGDTGSAVASAFLGREKFNVVLLYPSGKVSKVQEQQLTTFGQNVTALEIDGNFDDCQKLVKQAFSDVDLRNSVNLTSANSINIGRWLPQAVYYLHAWSQIQQKDSSRKPIFSVPSGNLGNLAAGLIANKHGVNLHRILGACNANATFSDFISTKKFRPRSSVRTLSNAMDVGNPSNFERIHHMFEGDASAIRKIVDSGSYSDKQTLDSISEIQSKYNYLACPHTAVGYAALLDDPDFKKGLNPGILLATAHPAKFGDVIEKVLPDPVPLPPELDKAMQQNKLSTEMNTDYTNFSNFLRDLPT